MLLVITVVIAEEPSVDGNEPVAVRFEPSVDGFELSVVGLEPSDVGFELSDVGFELSDVGFEVIAVIVVLIAVVSVEDKADVCAFVDWTVVEACIVVGIEDVDDAAELRVVDKDTVPLGLFVLK